MLFNSFHFLAFFPIVVLLYFLIPFKHRWALLLVASYYFYMCWKPQYIILILFTTGVSYFSALMIDKAKGYKQKKTFLILSVAINLGVLFLFKYFNFLNDSMKYVMSRIGVDYSINSFSLLLPMGISFYTFQSMSYTIDVYRGRTPVEKHFGYFALFVSFFPQLVAGPIERSENLLPQFYEKHKFEYARVTNGLKLMAWGLFKKVVLADTLAIAVNNVYNDPTSFKGLTLVIATVFFAFQIFCDFSGYTDIAIGAAEVMGFRLMENFKRPYYSKSIAEFWRRWHISLSTWFKDYVYIPLGGSRAGKARTYANLMITFMLSGLWHGANWTFFVWGMLHGFFQVFGKITQPFRGYLIRVTKIDKLPVLHNCLKIAITFSFVCFGWIFFRANTISDGIYIIRNLFSGIDSLYIARGILDLRTIITSSSLLTVLFSLFVMEFVHFMQRKGCIRMMLSERKTIVRWFVYVCLIVFIILFRNTESQQFIYFQF